MDDALLDVVLDRLDKVPLAAEALLLAALQDEASLSAALDGQPVPGTQRPVTGRRAEPAGAYLKSVTVAGFRGVGPACTLQLQPGPGLTLVVGRNGSGKSSFADGLEMLLTGQLKRWERLSATWQEGWRNLHVPDPTAISAKVLLEDAGPAIIERRWQSAARLAESRATVQVAGEQRAGVDRLDWRDALTTYRPFLSHSELEAFIDGPSHLYDLLSSVLGLEDLIAAEQRLTSARRAGEGKVKDVGKELPALLSRLAAIDDERARTCYAVLAAKRPELDRALVIAAGTPNAQLDAEINRLRQLGQLIVPTQAEVSTTVARLRAVAGELAGRASPGLGVADLLRNALGHYLAHGPGNCPVCGAPSAMDESWRRQAEHQVARLEAESAQTLQARSRAGELAVQARALFLPVPAILREPAIGTVDPVPAWQAWTVWSRFPAGDGPDELQLLADQLERRWPALAVAVTALVASANAELQAREDRWIPIAAEVASWCTRAQEAGAAAAAVAGLRAATTWLKAATDDIRNDRLAPLGTQARSIWDKLRQESNVDLGAIRLSGSGTRRQVDLRVTVDGSPGAALGVMSQGEVNALALSIFLPRATVAGSPFRFLVIDDPVQAMDPAKVEGLAQVLQDVAATRQVIVFTHDDRLPEAVRRLSIPARILEVSRRPASVVQVRAALTPVERQLKDALDLCAEDALPASIGERVVPGICRLAVEAAFIEAIRRQQLGAGKRHADVEVEIEAADTLTKKASLAMFGDLHRGGEVYARLKSWQHDFARTQRDSAQRYCDVVGTYRALNKGAHEASAAPLRRLVADSRHLTELIRQKLP